VENDMQKNKEVLNELYKMMGINIFEHTPVRPNARQKKSVQEFS